MMQRLRYAALVAPVLLMGCQMPVELQNKEHPALTKYRVTLAQAETAHIAGDWCHGFLFDRKHADRHVRIYLGKARAAGVPEEDIERVTWVVKNNARNLNLSGRAKNGERFCRQFRRDYANHKIDRSFVQRVHFP